jgi:HSP20 family molecular chaperone IbpA
MKKGFFVLLFLIFGFNTQVFSQTAEDSMAQQMEEIMKTRDEMLKMLMDDSTGSGFEKRMQEMMKRFDRTGFDQMFDGEAPAVGEYDWAETNTQRILKLKVSPVKNQPLDIKIEKGMIKIKGNVETVQGQGKGSVRQKVIFERSFSLPDDVDQANPEFENKDGFYLIKFKKLKATTKTPEARPKEAPAKKVDERMPVPTTENDLTI